MNAGMYIFLNKGLGMSTGKSAAQASHAAIEAFRFSEQRMIEAWYSGGHYAKYVMEARDAEHLRTIKDYLHDRGFSSCLIIDEGHTEVPPITVTALGVEVVDRDDPHTKATFESFKLYRDAPVKPPVIVLEASEKLTHKQWTSIRDLIEKGEIGKAKDYLKAARDYDLSETKLSRHWWSTPIRGERLTQD